MLFWIRNNRLVSRILIVKLILAFGVFTLYPLEVDARKRVRVRGYYRKDGTYVRPHYRSAPDRSPYNNYSYPGNYNPNTGKITTGDPQKYLERYYNRSSSRTSSVSFETWLKNLDSGTQAGYDVKIQGYYRKDGTYVKPHTRSAPDGSPYNNYSYPGNYNPNTGKITPGNPSKPQGVVSSGAFTVGSTMKEVAAIQGTPDSFSEGRFGYGYSNVYFKDGRVTNWYSTRLSPLKVKLAAPSTNKKYFTVGSTKEEVVAIQGTPDSFSETYFRYGYSNVHFKDGRVTDWDNSTVNPLKVKLTVASINNGYFTVGSTKEEVIAIQGTPDLFSETYFGYGYSNIYFKDGRVTGWHNSTINPLKVKLAAIPTNKIYFTMDSTVAEVAAIQGTPDSFTETYFRYGYSNIYFKDGRVTGWYSSTLSPLRVR